MAFERITSYTHDGLTFDVIDAGPIDGETIVLLHGFPQMASSWSAVTERLNADGYRTLAPDQRGYSPGARPRGRKAYRVDNLVGDVVALIERLGSPVHLVGHDWGAMVGWSLVARHPELVRTWTSVSVPHPAAFVRSMTRSTQPLKSWYMAFFQLPFIPELVLTRFPAVRDALLGHAGMDRALLDRVGEEMVRGGALRGGLGYYRALPFLSPTPRVRVPTTHVWSAGDTALVRRGAEMTADFVEAPYRLEVLPRATHWIPDQEPDALSLIVVERVRGDAG